MHFLLVSAFLYDKRPACRPRLARVQLISFSSHMSVTE